MLVLCSATSWYGMVVRSYQSFKLLKVESQSSPEYDTLVREALHFWVGFALISVFEAYVEMFVSWLPLYSFCKLALLWYIILPQTKGSTVLFEHVIEPKFRARVKRFELWLLEMIHTHVLTYTSTRDLELNKVVGQTDEELEGLLLHAQEINQLVEREKLRRSSQSMLMASASASTLSSSNSSREEFVVVTPPPPRPLQPASAPRQVIQPSHYPARGYTTHQAGVVGEAVYLDDVAVAVAVAVAVDDDEEEISVADEALDLIDSPSMAQRLTDWLPSPGHWAGMLSFAAATPVNRMRTPPPPPTWEEDVVVVVEDTPAPLRRSSRHARAPSFDTDASLQTSSFTNRILTRRQAAAAAAASGRH